MPRHNEIRRRRRHLSAVTPLRPEPHPSVNVRVWAAQVRFLAWDRWDLFESEVDKELAWLGGGFSVAAPVLPAHVSPAVRAAFEPGKDAMNELLGHWQSIDDQGNEYGWKSGLAGLEPQEAQAFRLWLRRFSLKEIALHMDRRSARFGEDHLPLETVKLLIYRARKKLQEALGAAGAPGGSPSTTISLTSQHSSTSSPDASEPLTMTPRTPYKTPCFATSSEAAA